jgi:AraC-like DNA-binding protein
MGNDKAAASVVEVWSARDVPDHDRMDYWHHVVAGTCGSHAVRMPQGIDPTDQLRLGTAGGVRIDKLRVSRTLRADRTVHHIRQDPDRSLCKVHVVASGIAKVTHNGREAVLAPGDFVLVDNERPVSKLMESVHFVTVAFPKTMFPLRPDEVSTLAGWRVGGDTGLGGLASSFVRQLVGLLDAWDEAGGVRLGTAVLDLLTVALAAQLSRDASVPPDTLQRTRLVQIHGFIERRLGDLDLSPATVAAANFVSVRYLHRLFETQETTVAAWIRQRRLERCRRDLADPALQTVPVSSIAARWGLTNPSQFSRQFRAVYGRPPTEYRRDTSGG